MKKLFSFLRRLKEKFTTQPVPEANNPSVAKAVLEFLIVGLTNGAESIAQTYQHAKVDEFVIVSTESLKSLKDGYENHFANGVVVLSMKINQQQEHIELTQIGRDVMLSFGSTASIIHSMTLADIYANLRNDMIKHPEIYGKERQESALSYPDPSF